MWVIVVLCLQICLSHKSVLCVPLIPTWYIIKVIFYGYHCNTVHITGLIHNLVHKARNTVRELDSQNDLTFLRLRSKKHEIMCAPGKFSFSSSFEFHQTANQTCQLV